MYTNSFFSWVTEIKRLILDTIPNYILNLYQYNIIYTQVTLLFSSNHTIFRSILTVFDIYKPIYWKYKPQYILM